MSTLPKELISQSPEETQALARNLVEHIPDGTVVALHGNLGAGKTCLVQGMARAMGITSVVNSPTYTIINECHGARTLYHIDLYRISGTDEALALGLEEYLDPKGLTAIEWAERAQDLLPATAVHVFMEPGEAEEERLIRIERGAPS